MSGDYGLKKTVNVRGFPYPVQVSSGMSYCETIKGDSRAWVQFNHPRTHYNVGFGCPSKDAGPLRQQLEGMAAEIVEALHVR